MGYPELLRVLGEEAAREARDVRAAADRERARILDEAGAASRAERAALLARVRQEAEARRRGALGALALERERTLLAERRALLEALRRDVRGRLAGAGSPDLDRRLLAEVLPEAGEGPIEVIVDPGAEEAARDSLAALAPGRAGGAVVRAAPARRGGVELWAGKRVLDDTLPSRLERAWPAIEPELAAILWEEG